MAKNYQSKETVLVITVGFLVLFFVFKHRVFLYCALGIGLAGVFSFYLSEKIHWVWNKLSFLLVAVIRRLGKRGGLRRFDGKATTNFSRREHVFEKKDLENTW